MATGDLYNNLEKLRLELRNTCMPQDKIDMEAIKNGNPIGFLPVLHFILLDESIHIARFLADHGYNLYPINDQQFLEGVFRVVRKEFSYRPSLTVEQFLSGGFAERKIIFLCDVIKLCKRKAEELERHCKDTTKSTTEVVNGPSSSSSGSNASKRKPSPSTSLSSATFSAVRSPIKPLTRTEPNRTPRKGDANKQSADRGTPIAQKVYAHQAQLQTPNPVTGSWRAKRSLTLQTNMSGTQYDDARSPLSSGPVSPVSITSAASAPAVFRQVPVKAKADMMGHVKPSQAYQSQNTSEQQLHSVESELQGGVHISSAERAMEYWVTSPPQPIERGKKKDVFAAHIKAQASPRHRAALHSNMSRTSSFESVQSANQQRRYSLKSASSSPHQATRKTEIDSDSKRGGGRVPTSQRGKILHLSSPTVDGHEQRNIARRLSLPSTSSSVNGENYDSPRPVLDGLPSMVGDCNVNTSSVASTPASSVYADASSANAAQLADQVTKVVSTLEALSTIPARMEEMERTVSMALQSMNRRISEMDDKIKVYSPKAKSPNGSTSKSKAAIHPTNSTKKVTKRSDMKTSQSNQGDRVNEQAASDDGIVDFLKVIEQRFQETETVLAESQNHE